MHPDDCAHDKDWLARSGAIVICSDCGMTFVLDADGSLRRAKGLDVDRLPPDDLTTLRVARAAWRRSHAPPGR